MQRWAGRPIWLRSAEASVERWTPPFCGIRTSVFCWLGIQSVCSPVPRHEKRAGDILGHGLLQPPWNWGWWGRRGGCFRPPAFGGWRGGGLVWGPQQTRRDTCRPLQCVCVCVLGGGGDILWVRMECLSHCLPLQLSAPIASTLLLALACFKFTHSQTTNLLLEGALHRR